MDTQKTEQEADRENFNHRLFLKEIESGSEKKVKNPEGGEKNYRE